MMESLLPNETPSSLRSCVPLTEVSPTELLEEAEAEALILPGFNRSCSVEARRSKPRTMIDNSNLTYLPMHLVCGVTVYCRPDVLTRCPQILRDLDLDVRQCLTILPRSTHKLIKRTNIWVNTTYYYGPCSKPKNVNHSTAHHHEAWLMSVLDRSDKAPGIEIYNCFDYRKMRWHWNGCGLLLHELCHIVHQFCLGLDNAVIEQAYAQAKMSGKYDTTLRRDWAGSAKGETDMAYAMVNPKELFAELSVAYWSQGYEDMVRKDPESMKESSPPFTAPDVIDRLDPDKQYPIADRSLFMLKVSPWCRPKARLPPHCNKFYPFTRGQLECMDPQLCEILRKLWQEIENWQDDEGADCFGRQKRCWPC
mmetsp:Transcript_31877/g.52573  ORF Transcript_31877/g.52573 Transcript_31877/m.52573 type:complete len:365 (-) Transcript_31877:804-1898(-)